MGQIVLVDGMNLLYKSHFAHKTLSYEGKPTGTFYGFLSALNRMRRHLGDNLIVCWDRRTGDTNQPNWRTPIFPRYKQNRKKDEDTQKIINSQIGHLVWVVEEVLGFPSLQIPGLEADDLMGLLVTGHPEHEFLIASSDHDLYQLVSPNCQILVVREGRGYSRLTRKKIEAEYAVPLKRWAEYLALGGDKSDGIRVLPKIGPKNAAKLLQQGISAILPWSAQPEAIRGRYPEWEPLWPEVKAAFRVAAIPRRPQDGRIARYTASYKGLPRLSPPPGRLERLGVFMEFCGEHGLSEFMAIRRQMVR